MSRKSTILSGSGKNVCYIQTFSAMVSGVFVTTIGTIYVILDVFCEDRGSGEKYIVQTLTIDIPQKLYLDYIQSDSTASAKIKNVISEEIINMVPETLRCSNDASEIAEKTDLGPFLKWKFPVQKKSEKWKCKICNLYFPSHHVRWIGGGSNIFSARFRCIDCGKLQNRRRAGTFIVVTHSGSRVILSESEAETYMSIYSLT
jgi:hypothetical protein